MYYANNNFCAEAKYQTFRIFCLNWDFYSWEGSMCVHARVHVYVIEQSGSLIWMN